MAKVEKLPSGFERLPSGSIRVRLRIKGFPAAVSVFPLFADSAEERRRQRGEAEVWATATRRKLLAGLHVSTREAEKMTLGDALRQYREKGLTGRETNAQKDRNRIDQILADPISLRSVASLRKTDIAVYRDSIQAAAVEARGTTLARTTVSNKIQLVHRALSFVGELIEGVPDLTGVKMPAASPGRERRVSGDEMKRLLHHAGLINPLLPLIIRFAVLTALRRERVLDFRLSYIRNLGHGQRVIKYPVEKAVKNKRTGIIPVTRDLDQLLREVKALRSLSQSNDLLLRDEPLLSININTLDHQWRRTLVASKIVDLHFHDLRHEATSRLFEKGLNFVEVMSITGHSTTEMVDRYSHYSAVLVLEKLDKGMKADDVFTNIRFLLESYSRQGGDVESVEKLLAEHAGARRRVLAEAPAPAEANSAILHGLAP